MSKVTRHGTDDLEFECGHKPGARHRLHQPDEESEPVIDDIYDEPGAPAGPAGSAEPAASSSPGEGTDDEGTKGGGSETVESQAAKAQAPRFNLVRFLAGAGG